jgi:hypothetical protein
MARGSVDADSIVLETGYDRDGQIIRSRWELVHVAVGTLRGTVRADGCAGDCDWPVLGCEIEAGLQPSCDEGGDCTELLNCLCAPPSASCRRRSSRS